ncbi:MAG: hypothetical protein JSS29_02235 [Proteobacteria bacterium]|nr:hypothetical protein [Pseudomonadota bacterium]
MNEIQLIRTQLSTEREHLGAVARACASVLGKASPAALASGTPLEAFRQASVDYLVCVLAWFEERDRRLAALLGQYGPEHATRDALEDALSLRGRSREALEKLEAAFASGPSDGARNLWAEFAKFFDGPWASRRDAVDALLAHNTRPSDWRAFAAIDADGILEERSRFDHVSRTLPAGASLAAPPVLGG